MVTDLSRLYVALDIELFIQHTPALTQ